MLISLGGVVVLWRAGSCYGGWEALLLLLSSWAAFEAVLVLILVCRCMADWQENGV